MLPAPPQAGFVLPPPLSLAQQVDRPTARSVQLSKKGEVAIRSSMHQSARAAIQARGVAPVKLSSEGSDRYYVAIPSAVTPGLRRPSHGPSPRPTQRDGSPAPAS